MSASIRFHDSQVTIANEVTKSAFVVELGTPLLDAVLHLEQSGMRHALVSDTDSNIVGVVTLADLLRYMVTVERDETGSWKSRPVEDLMTTRFQPSASYGRHESRHEEKPRTIRHCISLMEDGRPSAFITDDDLFISWNRIEPLLRAAHTDGLTELANRSLFVRRFDEEWSRSSRNGDPLALVILDVDQFKEINDRYGHQAGDIVLSEIGSILRESTRRCDVVGRIGGDEFAILCCNSDPMSIAGPIRRIQEKIHSRKASGPWMLHSPTLSVGAAVVRGGFDDLSTEIVFAHADACLYKAKAAGRDCAYEILLDGAIDTFPRCVDRKLVEDP